MTIHNDRIDFPLMGSAYRELRQTEADQRADFWKQKYDNLLNDTQTLLVNLKESDKPVRVVLGQIDMLVKRVDE